MGTSKAPDPAVVVAGGGPIGLALAAELGRRGVRTLLVDAGPEPLGDRQPGDAKMIQVSVRTMEFCRQLGIGEQVRDWGFPPDHGLDSVFVTTLTGHELGRVRTPTLADMPDSPASPERDRPCPQTWFDPILRRFARDSGHVAFRYKTRLTSFGQDSGGVTVTVEDGDGLHTLRAGYLVGCDGAGSTVRSLLGIEVRGERHLDRSMSVYVTVPGLDRFHDKGSAYRYVMVGPAGTWAVLTTIDGRDLYRLQLIGADLSGRGEDEIIRVLHRCVGAEVPCAIEGSSAWDRQMTVADRFSDGRVFLAGDAAHAHPPNGGLGMNTGIPDAWDLGWKLAAVLHGWGGPDLLDSYTLERHPVFAGTGEAITRGIADDRAFLERYSPQRDRGEFGRAWGGRTSGEVPPASYEPHYEGSPIVWADPGSAGGVRGGHTFEARAGHHLAPAALSSGRNVFERLAGGFTLVTLGADEEPARAFQAAADELRIPLRVIADTADGQRAAYGRRLILVRPDQYVAWTADAPPADAAAVLRRAAGVARPPAE